MYELTILDLKCNLVDAIKLIRKLNEPSMVEYRTCQSSSSTTWSHAQFNFARLATVELASRDIDVSPITKDSARGFRIYSP